MEAFRPDGAGELVPDAVAVPRASVGGVRRTARPAVVFAGVLVSVGVTAFLRPVPAGAGASGSDGSGGTVSVGASGGGSQPGSPGTAGGVGSGGAGSPWICTDTPLTLNDESQPPGGPLPGGWFSVTCVDLQTGAMVTNTQWITQAVGGAAAPAVDPHALALAAERSLRLPDPQPSFSPGGSAVVNLPTWLWVDPSIWHPQSVTASAGGVTATAMAAPVSVSWSMGDGTTVVCDGPGVAYDPSQSPNTQSTTCEHTYAVSSAGQPSPDGNPDDASFSVTVTVNWSVSWSAVGAPGGGALPSLTTAATVAERVKQVESVNALAGAPRFADGIVVMAIAGERS
jgi:hypothetical protein